ncbi:MAG TPA: ADOP family duplicated permease [Vicinamibacterales bacterium]|nr:ADOP family duplicated permease [Vicinamibacterales bacterium]
MNVIDEWFRRLSFFLRRRTMEDELRREMEAHRAMMADPRQFGNTLRLRDEARDAWGWRWLDDLAQDTRFAWRTLRRSPGFTLTAVITLAFGIGVNIGMLRLVNGLLLRPLYERPAQILEVQARSTKPDGGRRGVSYPDYLDLRDGTKTIFDDLAASSFLFVGLDAGEGPRRAIAFAVTANYFDVLGGRLALGRPFDPNEERPGADARLVIISHRLWQQRGADPAIIGRTVRINGDPFTVVGVAAEGFTGTGIPGPEVWLPLGANDRLSARDSHELAVIGRVQADVPVENVGPALATIARRLEQAFPDVNGGYSLTASPPSRLLFMPGSGSAITTLIALLLMVMPAIVLLVACLNLADLLLARGHIRRQELAIRSSLGGGRWRITRQLLTEGVLLAFAGAAAGAVLSSWATDVVMASIRPVLPVALSLPALDIDWRVIAGTVGFSMAASLVFGAWPAWSLTSRAVVSDLKRHIGEEGRQPGGIRIGKALVVCQLALSLLLLTTGGLFLMSAISAASAYPGFDLDGGVLAEVDASLAGYDETRGRQLQLALVDRLRAVPGVEAASIGSSFPFNGFGDSRLVAPAGGADPQSRSVDAVFAVVGRDYARVLGLPLLSGRDFSDAELLPGSAERVAIIDDALAQRLGVGTNAVGQLIQFLDKEASDAKQPLRVIGVVPTINHSLGNAHPFPHVYVPLGQRYESAMTLHVRTSGTEAERAMLGTVGRVIRDVDPRAPVVRLTTWRDHLDAGIEVLMFRTGARVFSAFGIIALLLAIIGVYGVKSYVVSRRTREFGIRIATGAQPRALLWQVLREGGRTTTIGIGIGLLLALGAGQLLQGMLYGVRSIEPLVLAGAPLILFAASLLASLVPAVRATRVDPTVALRSE